ncbi:MAG: hypothetical protein ACSHW7_11810 [Patiriisocius sp.]|uniref:hypothetical protein n=1 Tax=Patiriisocius sp. TaxID=2822396 RepID=UPI003EF0A604
MKNIALFFTCIVAITTIISCDENKKQTSISLDGNYEFLEDNGVKIFLPENFERISLATYTDYANKNNKNKQAQYTLRYVNELKQNKGNVYIFLNKENGATVITNTMEFMSFNKEDAQQLLGMMTMNNDRVAEETKLEYENLTAKYNHMEGHDIFKSVYKVDDKSKKGKSWFNNSYIMTANGKTIYMQMASETEMNYDPFVLKTKM